ncbi:enoyl-CoA delta isomerase 3, peroxisomal-like isoform X2 [Homarus americanus]|uniref:enoyl-CoA delta isomerase 3, peroxisomal-like isoform X2 n=1 Tax=Homarus americanus TaxID=6706 RepID=UPI001C446429|nr:enoyl-CoA delta isomerase 3, peroxisomal-like isoform X2 [Homarus americanus]
MRVPLNGCRCTQQLSACSNSGILLNCKVVLPSPGVIKKKTSPPPRVPHFLCVCSQNAHSTVGLLALLIILLVEEWANNMSLTRSLLKLQSCVGLHCPRTVLGRLPWNTKSVDQLDPPKTLPAWSSRTMSTDGQSSGNIETASTYTDTSQYEHLTITLQHGVRTITFNRPEKKNALNEKMFAEVATALQEAANDPNTIIAATTGAGNVYTGGNDKSNFHHMPMIEIRDLLTRHMAAFIDFPKPLVAVVNGASVGVGTTLLPLFDAVFATEKITAREARKLGLVTDVYPDATFQEEVWPRIYDMAKLPLKSLVYSKALSRDIHKDALHQVNIEECKRVTERLTFNMQRGEEHKEFIRTNWPNCQ